MAATSCQLVPLEPHLEGAVLPHVEKVILGRDEKFNIVDIRCSRKQLSLTADYEQKIVKIRVIGTAISCVDGIELVNGNTLTAKDCSIIEVVKGAAKYKVEFSKNRIRDEPLEENKQKKRRGPSSYDWTPYANGEVLVCKTDDFDDTRDKVASFDMDGTIIRTKSGHVFPVDIHDWTLWHESVKPKIQQVHQDGYKVIIFTNQAALGTPRGKVLLNQFKMKIEGIITALEVPACAYISTREGLYRKPAPGMWKIMEKRAPFEYVNLAESFYCGDAAGRPANWKPGRKADFAVSDRLFAMNVGVKFLTPEEYFLNEKPAPFTPIKFDPKILSDCGEIKFEPSTSQEIIIMVGPPGSGKSHFVKHHLIANGYHSASRDELGTWQRCISFITKYLNIGKSVVIDNTNPTIESRQRYIEVGKHWKVKVRCCFMETTLQRCLHNNKFRMITNSEHAVISPSLIKKYFSNLERPTCEEGFYEVVSIPFSPVFENNDEKNKILYFQHLLSK